MSIFLPAKKHKRYRCGPLRKRILRVLFDNPDGVTCTETTHTVTPCSWTPEDVWAIMSNMVDNGVITVSPRGSGYVLAPDIRLRLTKEDVNGWLEVTRKGQECQE